VSLNQATKTKKPTIPPKPSEDILAYPSIINIIRQTSIRLACKDILEINDVMHKLDARTFIEINSSPLMKGKWLFDIGTIFTCMPHNNSG
jgi:hypothetical protein